MIPTCIPWRNHMSIQHIPWLRPTIKVNQGSKSQKDRESTIFRNKYGSTLHRSNNLVTNTHLPPESIESWGGRSHHIYPFYLQCGHNNTQWSHLWTTKHQIKIPRCIPLNTKPEFHKGSYQYRIDIHAMRVVPKHSKGAIPPLDSSHLGCHAPLSVI